MVKRKLIWTKLDFTGVRSISACVECCESFYISPLFSKHLDHGVDLRHLGDG